MKLKFWANDPQLAPHQTDEADAMRGKYILQDLEWRKKQHLANEFPGPLKADDKGKVTRGEERAIDQHQRQLSIVTNGQGAQGKTNPISAENRQAFERLSWVKGWADENLKPTNRFVKVMETLVNAKSHTIFDRSVTHTEPEIVLTYKPMTYAGPAPALQTSDELENTKKKP